MPPAITAPATEALIDRLKAGERIRSFDIDGRLLRAALADGRVAADPITCLLVAAGVFRVEMIDRRTGRVYAPAIVAFDAAHATAEALRLFRWQDPAPHMIEARRVCRIVRPADRPRRAA